MPLATRRAVLALAAAPAAGRAAAEDVEITLATGLPGGVYDVLGAALARLLAAQPGLRARTETTGGSVANLQLLGRGEVAACFAQADAAIEALRGEGHFRGAAVPARALAVLYAERLHIVATAASGIRGVEGLRGRRVSTGAPGSATEILARRVLAAAGLDIGRDLRPRRRFGPAESNAAMLRGELDAYFFVAGIPSPAVAELAANPALPVILLDHAGHQAELARRHGPIYLADVIPAGTYPGQQRDNHQLSVMTLLAVAEAMPAERAALLLRTAWAAREDWAAAHPQIRDFTLARQTRAAAAIPWHPAAAAFWRAAGAEPG